MINNLTYRCFSICSCYTNDFNVFITFSIKIIGYFFEKACIVKLKDSQDEKKVGFKISMFPWMPLSEDSNIPVPSDWVVTIVEPKDQLKKMYLEDVVGNGTDSKDSDSSESTTSDQ